MLLYVARPENKKMRQKLWLTPGIYIYGATTNKMYDKAYNKKNAHIYNIYKLHRNNLSTIIKVAKQQYHYTLISSDKNDKKITKL